METCEKIQEKNIITKLKKDLVNYEMQKLTVGHQKETIDRMEKDIELFKTQTSKVIDNLLERQETSKSNSRSPGATTELLIVNVGHNSIDKGVSAQEATTQLKETVDKFMPKFKPHGVAICKIGPVKDGCYGRKTNNYELSKFNDHLEMISLELDGSYPWSRIEILENALSIDDICFDGEHPKNGGKKCYKT